MISTRTAAVFLLLVAGAALACRPLDAEQVSLASFKVVTATFAMALVPGALVTLFWRPRTELTVLETMGFGVAISVGLIQLMTMLAVIFHVDAGAIVAVLLAGSALTAVLVIRRPSGTIRLSTDELVVSSLLVGLSVCLYIVGSPVDAYEDQVHVSIVRRLSEVNAPRLENLYMTPGVIYTYPFPGTHYMMALIARLGDIDPLFLYHKLRFFWGPVAIVMVYLAARSILGFSSLASAAAVTAIVLVSSGVFAMVQGFPFGWAQLATYSHASDIAMGVLLPALLVVAFGYLQADTRREGAFFLTATGMLLLMLTVVHIREAVQFTVYLGCFLLVTLVVARFRGYWRRTAALVGLAVGIAATYAMWHALAVPMVDDIVDTRRADLMSTVAGTSLQSLIFSPASSVIGDYLPEFEHIWDGLTPMFLFAGPVVILLFRRKPLVWLIASSTAAYVALMSVPLLAIPYIYLTYFEILYTPARNLLFFVYALAGVVPYVLVVALRRIDRTPLSALFMGTVAGAVALLTTLCINRSHLGFFVPLMAAYASMFLLARSDALTLKLAPRTIAVALLSAIGLVLLWSDHGAVRRSEQVTIRWSSNLPDVRRTEIERQFSLDNAEPKPDRTEEINAWNYRLQDLSVDNVRRIVEHPDVVDTHFIDRFTFEVESQAPPGDHALGVRYVRWLQYPGTVLMAFIAIWVWALAMIVPAVLSSARGREQVAPLEAAMSAPFYRHAIPFALFIIPFALWSARPTLSPVVAAFGESAIRAATPSAMMATLPCLTSPRMQARFTAQLFPDDPVMLPERTTCPPDPNVVEWLRRHVPVEGVLAVDRWNPYPPPMFVPQQVVVFPTLDALFTDEDRLFDDYYTFFYERMRRYRQQPFFNSVETSAERMAFIEGLGVTHVLVDPAYYDELRPVLDRLPELFALRYSQGHWAVYEVLHRTSGRLAGV